MPFVKLLAIILTSALYVDCLKVNKRSVNPPNCGVRPETDFLYSHYYYVEDPLEEEDGLKEEEEASTPQIVGGDVATEPWPWMVSIGKFFGIHFCGGAVIDEKHILTAAHCLAGQSNDLQIRVGDRAISDVYEIESFTVHEEYDPSPNWFNDIAIITLTHPLPEYVIPICLPDEDTIEKGDTLSIIGYGAMEERGKASGKLLEVHDLTVTTVDECTAGIQSLHKGHNGVTDKQVCTALESETKGSCQGDSGGPVMKEIDGKWTLIGLVSFSVGCARPGIPTVHTRVAKYRDWIDKHIDA